MRNLKARLAVSCILLLLLISSMCAAEDIAVDLNGDFGYYNGGRLYYVLTDVSNSNLQVDLANNPYVSSPFGISITPKLRNAIAPGVNLPVLYYSINQDQPLVFGTQWPSSTYMPIWRVIKIKWNIPVSQRYALKSALDVNLAKQSGKVTLTTTDIVIAASIVINTAGAVIPQGQAGYFNGDVWITLPTFIQYDGVFYAKALYLDFGYQSEASFYGANYAPALNQLNKIRAQGLPDAWRRLYARFVNYPNQYPITPTGPSEPGYSPLVNEWQLTARNVFPTPPITSVSAIPNAWIKTPTNFMGYEPIIQLFYPAPGIH